MKIDMTNPWLLTGFVVGEIVVGLRLSQSVEYAFLVAIVVILIAILFKLDEIKLSNLRD